MFRLTVIALLPFLSGCQSICWPTCTVTNPNPNANFEKDSYECDKDVAAVQNHVRMVEMHRACMRQKGWRPE